MQAVGCSAAQRSSLAGLGGGGGSGVTAAGQTFQWRPYCAEPEAQEEPAVYTIDVFTGVL